MIEEQSIWKEMEQYAMKYNPQGGVFANAISDINKKKHEMRGKHPELFLNTNEIQQVQSLSQEQPLEVSDLAVDLTEPKIEEPLGIEQTPQLEITAAVEPEPQSYHLHTQPEQATELQTPAVEHQVAHQVENGSIAQESNQAVNPEPHFRAEDFQNELAGISSAFMADSATEQSIASYQAEKAQKHDLAVMESEFASTFDEHRHALPLENDGSLRDFFHNTRNGESIQIFSTGMQNLTTGEIIESYKNSKDPIAEHKLNQAMDIGYREMLKTHKEERQALYDNPNSTSEDLERFEKQVSLETGMYDHHLKTYQYDLHQDYVKKLEQGPQNRETQLEIYNAKEATPEVPNIESLQSQYQEYKAMTPHLEDKRQELSQSIKNEEQSIGQSLPKQEVSENILKMRQQNPEFAKKVEANLQNPDYMDKVNRIKQRLEPELNIARNKALKIA